MFSVRFLHMERGVEGWKGLRVGLPMKGPCHSSLTWRLRGSCRFSSDKAAAIRDLSSQALYPALAVALYFGFVSLDTQMR